MSEAERENQLEGFKLPIDLHVSDTIHNQYVQNVIVQPGQSERVMFFFETHIPPFAGSPEENRELLENEYVITSSS